MTLDAAYLDALFGPGEGTDPVARATVSSTVYVRGLDLLALEHSTRATGRRLTAVEALETYGLETLIRVAEEGSALISYSTDAAGRTLRARREQLGVSTKHVASAAGLTLPVVQALEESRKRPIQEYERVARTLALGEGDLSFKPVPTQHERIAVRLRTIADEKTSLPAATVLAIAEATWVASTQLSLESRLGNSTRDLPLRPTPDLGGGWRPPFAVGYELAQRFRKVLNLGEEPIPSMRALAEDTLGLPVILTTLDPALAGATVEIDRGRAIVLNLVGPNVSPMVRRATVAHELCHLFFDPSGDLEDLRVDGYADLERRPDQHPDPIEQRANAFAVELLAPQNAAVRRFHESGRDLHSAVLDYFGISFTAGRYQVWNGLDRRFHLDEIGTAYQPPEDDWEGRESFTVSYHPIEALLKHPSRAGRFSALTVRAAELGLISWDTASQWLWSTTDDLTAALPWMRDLYPDVF